ncbi:MAG: hypothetical protein RJA20_18 [Bacteroidota bacterium]
MLKSVDFSLKFGIVAYFKCFFVQLAGFIAIALAEPCITCTLEYACAQESIISGHQDSLIELAECIVEFFHSVGCYAIKQIGLGLIREKIQRFFSNFQHFLETFPVFENSQRIFPDGEDTGIELDTPFVSFQSI